MLINEVYEQIDYRRHESTLVNEQIKPGNLDGSKEGTEILKFFLPLLWKCLCFNR